jgi:hypothetical protein
MNKLPEEVWNMIRLFPCIMERIHTRPAAVKQVNQVAIQVTGAGSVDDAYKAILADCDTWIKFCTRVANDELRLKQSVSKRSMRVAKLSRYKKSVAMSIVATLGIGCCMVIITCCKDILSHEAVNLIYTTAGVFGACLKDAFAFEFGSADQGGAVFKDFAHRMFVRQKARARVNVPPPSMKKKEEVEVPDTESEIEVSDKHEHELTPEVV